MMFSVRRQLALLSLAAICLCFSPAIAAQRYTHRAKKKPVAKVQQPDPAPAPPEPLRPEQLPSTPPKLSFQNGMLTILAQNSTLGDILRGVHTKTGAEIDVPGNASERVVGQFGPGSPRDVLASLLNGSHFNYVMVGTAADPNSVAQVILTARTGGDSVPSPSEPATAAAQNGITVQPPVNGQPFPPRSFPQPQVQGQVVDTTDEPAADSAEENQDESAQDQDNGENGDQGAPEQANQGEAGQNPNQPTVKTPEQLLQELQRQQQVMQQQQQQQQQQGQNPPQQQPQQPPQVVYPIPQLQQPPPQQK